MLNAFPAVFAGAIEFLGYMPQKTQAVVVVPVGETGVLVAGTNTQRGFGNLDRVRLITVLQ